MSWFSRLLAVCFPRFRPDAGLEHEAHRFGSKPPGEPGYDYQKAKAGFYRAKRRTASGRSLPTPQRRKGDLVRFPGSGRKQA